MSAQTKSTSQAQYRVARIAETDSSLSRIYRGMLASSGFAALLLLSAPTLAATAPALGTISTYAVVTQTLANTNPTTISGDYCYTTGANVTTNTNGTMTGACTTTPTTNQATALGVLTGQACTALATGTLNTENVGSGPGVFPPGCYSFGGVMSVAAGTVTLSGPGVFIFTSTGALNTAAGTSVIKANGACENDIFWAPGGATTLTGTSFVGNILSDNGITMAVNGTIVGRLLGYLGTLTSSNNTITKPTCTTSYPVVIPTLSEWAMITFALLIAGFGVYMQRRRHQA